MTHIEGLRHKKKKRVAWPPKQPSKRARHPRPLEGDRNASQSGTPDNSFLLFDNNEHEQDAPSRVLIFAYADMRFKASVATELFADGTDRFVPNGFATLYTVHSVIDGVPYPVFCLTQNER